MNYGLVITEELSFLLEQERQAGQAKVRDRIRFLRLLKSGYCSSQQAAGEAIGRGKRQIQRLWQMYQQHGYSALICPGYVHGFGKLSSSQMSRLQHFLRQDQAFQLADVQHYVAQEFGVSYSLSGLCRLFQRLKVKRKTGRPINIRQDAGQVEAFKKTLVP